MFFNKKYMLYLTLIQETLCYIQNVSIKSGKTNKTYFYIARAKNVISTYL